MILSPAWKGRKYAVLGLARTGRATVEALLAAGAEVTAWDSNEDAREAFAGRVTLADPVETDLTGFGAVLVTPGVPLNTHPIKPHADRFGVPVIGDIELFAQAREHLPPHKVVGITGTNGKSTTTALTHHILKTAGVPTTMGGNIGLPILGQDPLPEGGVYVLELSSYQIDLTFSLDCEVAVLLNVTPDHLDRYESFEAYGASKSRLFAMQTRGHNSIARFTDARVLGKFAEGSIASILEDVLANRGVEPSEQAEWPSLQGPHNLENAAAAIEACDILGLSGEQIRQGLRTFPGLPHRMERVGERAGVLYVNDSIRMHIRLFDVTDDGSLENGRVFTGRIVPGGDFRSPTLRVSTDPLDRAQFVEFAKAAIELHKRSPVSPMPKELVDYLSQNEILDLLAYINAAGRAEHPSFRTK